MNREFTPGDEVMLILDPAALGVVEGLKRFDCKRMKVSRALYARDKSYKAMQGAIYYELEGCTSELGVPYGILREWMFPVGGGKNGNSDL